MKKIAGRPIDVVDMLSVPLFVGTMIWEAKVLATREQRDEGDLDDAMSSAAKTFAQTYTQDHMAHIPMEPPVALANFADGKLEIWAPVQSPYQARTDAAAALVKD